jgi:hypothetical protein
MNERHLQELSRHLVHMWKFPLRRQSDEMVPLDWGDMRQLLQIICTERVAVPNKLATTDSGESMQITLITPSVDRRLVKENCNRSRRIPARLADTRFHV